MTVSETKRQLRQTLLAARAALFAAPAAQRAPHAIRDLFLDTFAPAAGTVVSAFWPMADELDMRPLLQALHARGCVCALPVVAKPRAPLLFREWAPGDVLTASAFGVAEPAPERAVRTPAIAVVPLLAFDDQGYRLGYGGGFYDRTLAELRSSGAPFTAVGVGLAGQRLPALPREAFDQPLDWALTEQGSIDCRSLEPVR
jgi:5-formyltetrahydrofolate cyclo-ligase